MGEIRKYFEFNSDGQDELVLLLPGSQAESLRNLIDHLLEEKLPPGKTGHYIAHQGTFKENP